MSERQDSAVGSVNLCVYACIYMLVCIYWHPFLQVLLSLPKSTLGEKLMIRFIKQSFPAFRLTQGK